MDILPAPKIELNDQTTYRLAYTRQTGWVVVKPGLQSDEHGHMNEWIVRPGARTLRNYEILAFAELPPPPPNAA